MQSNRVMMCVSFLDEFLTCLPRAMAQVVPMNHIRADRMRQYCGTWKRYKRVIGFRPTGWTFRGQAKKSAKRGPTSVQLRLDVRGMMVKETKTGKAGTPGVCSNTIRVWMIVCVPLTRTPLPLAKRKKHPKFYRFGAVKACRRC